MFLKKLLQNKKNRRKIFISGLIVYFLSLVFYFVFNYYETSIFNSVEHVSASNTDGKNVTFLTYPRGGDSDSWICEGVFVDKKVRTLKATIFEGSITNNNHHVLHDWKVRFDIDKDCYLNNAWCGVFEVHQFRDGKELVQTLDLRQIRNYDVIVVEHFFLNQEFLIPLRKGDYIVYCSDNVIENPVQINGGKVLVGFIFYYETNDFALKNHKVTYYMHKKMFERRQFYCFSCFVILLFAILIGFVSYDISAENSRKEINKKDKLIKESLLVFSNFVDAKDSYTNGHSSRVAEYSMKIAEKMGFSDIECKNIYYIALMHDCGKCYIPDEVLKKPGKLLPDEYEIIKKHTEYGAKILENFSSFPNITCGALYHHERYDGKGYPTGKAGEEIPFVARIICVADSFDAMNSSRCYREPLPMERIVSEIEKGRGTQFDPQIADIFLEIIKNEM